MSQRMKKILIVVCCALAVAACGLACWQYQARQRAAAAARVAEQAAAAQAAREAAREAAEQAAARLKALTVKARQPTHEYARPAPPPLVPRATVLDFLDQNPDTVGYIRIDGTVVDYPVVQGTDNDYYLYHTFDHIATIKGSIFVDCNVRFDPEILPPHILMHGHHMRDGSMFKTVSYYKTKSYFEENPYIHFETLYLDTVWQVFSVCVVNSNEYVPMAFRDDEAFLAYCEKVAERSMYPVDVSFTAEDRIMTLNTCSYEFSGAHTLVAAKLVEINYDIDWRKEAG